MNSMRMLCLRDASAAIVVGCMLGLGVRFCGARALRHEGASLAHSALCSPCPLSLLLCPCCPVPAASACFWLVWFCIWLVSVSFFVACMSQACGIGVERCRHHIVCACILTSESKYGCYLHGLRCYQLVSAGVNCHVCCWLVWLSFCLSSVPFLLLARLRLLVEGWKRLGIT